MTDTVIRWLSWWRAEFARDTHKSWELRWSLMENDVQDLLIDDSPALVRLLCNVNENVVPFPDRRVLTLLNMSNAEHYACWQLVSALLGNRTVRLTVDDREWCERIARGLRPQIFLPAGLDYSDRSVWFYLIQSAISPAVWERLRLRFPSDEIEEAESLHVSNPVIHLNRLRALLDAAFWRITEGA